jgi:DNA-binding GntR family transcriptional regulator
MERLPPQPSLVQQVYDAIVDAICAGGLPAGTHLVQEDLAERFGVSRQPIQQAMALLKADGMAVDRGRRGLQVVPLDLDLMDDHYEIRAALDGLAAGLAASRLRKDTALASVFAARGEGILRQGREAVERGDIAAQVRHDVALHMAIYDLSGNTLLARTAEPQWRFLRRAMADVLRRAAPPREIWRQHAAIVEAIVAGDKRHAEALAVDHDRGAARMLRAALDHAVAAPPSSADRRERSAR